MNKVRQNWHARWHARHNIPGPEVNTIRNDQQRSFLGTVVSMFVSTGGVDEALTHSIPNASINVSLSEWDTSLRWGQPVIVCSVRDTHNIELLRTFVGLAVRTGEAVSKANHIYSGAKSVVQQGLTLFDILLDSC